MLEKGSFMLNIAYSAAQHVKNSCSCREDCTIIKRYICLYRDKQLRTQTRVHVVKTRARRLVEFVHDEYNVLDSFFALNNSLTYQSSFLGHCSFYKLMFLTVSRSCYTTRQFLSRILANEHVSNNNCAHIKR